MDMMVDASRVMQVEKLLRTRSIEFEVARTEMCPLGQLRNKNPIRINSPRIRSPIKRGFDWKDYYSLKVIYSFLHELETKYPSTCTISVIGRTVEGREIKMLRISNSNANNSGVWLDGAIHAREWISACVVTYIADQLAKNFDTMPANITNKDWYFVPVANPDGYLHTHSVDRMWRKNKARIGDGVVGVDLNRNFGYKWGEFSAGGSSGEPNHNNYRGPVPFSEPETAAIKDVILYSSTPFKIFLTFHAYSELITFPWCYTSDPCPDYVHLLEGASKMAKAIYETNGRMYKVGNFRDLMYAASGTSIDWSYGTARIPFSYLVELRSKEHKFLLPKEHILDCCREVWNGIKALAEFVDNKKCLNCIVK